ncbi:hypothetical protein L0F63_000278 [Massospora cicadina]|nr:hypothetical protein L0F63_000278 [Massospora cicadina]
MRESHHYVEELLRVYEPNAHIFESGRYYETFTNYIELLCHIRAYLDAFEKKGLFMRLIRLDVYRRSLLNLARQVDRSILALRDGLSLQGEGDLAQRLNSAQLEMDHAMTRFDSMQNHVAGSEGQREQLITHIQLAELGTKDIIDAVEIPSRRVKAIPGDQPRQGRNFTVHRRLYDGHEVAEKVYRASISDDRNQQQIRKQVAILKKLEMCPYIIRFYGIHRKTNGFGLISEYATMGSLKELIEADDPLEHRVKIGVTSGMVAGVAFLHNVGIIHKNLKTSSVLVMRDMSAKLSGFEFSREVEMETVQVVDLGSDRFRWIPPEKIRSGVHSTTMGDIYSLGMALWSLWSGLYPYRDRCDRTHVESFVLAGGREDLSLLPSSVRSLVDQCLHEDPGSRPSAADLINSLDQFFPKELDTSDSACSSDCGHELSPTASNSIFSSASSSRFHWRPSHYSPSPTSDSTPALTPTKPSLTPRSGPMQLAHPPSTFSLSQPSEATTHDTLQRNAQPSETTTPDSLQRNAQPPEATETPSHPKQRLTTAYSETPSHPKQRLTTAYSETPNPLKQRLTTAYSETPNPLKQRLTTAYSETPNPLKQRLTTAYNDSRNAQPSETTTHDSLQRNAQAPTLESAVLDHNQGRYREAFAKFRTLCQSRVNRAEYFVGYYYFWGQDGVVGKDLTRAAAHLSRAANSGDSDALDLLGMVYRDPAHPAADPLKAFQCFLQAAKLGNRKGYYHLFAAYAAGRGAPRDPIKARAMLLASARMGYPSAIRQATKLGLKPPF